MATNPNYEKAIQQCKAMGGEMIKDGCRIKKCGDGLCTTLIVSMD